MLGRAVGCALVLVLAVCGSVTAQSADPLTAAYDAGMKAFHSDDLEAAARHFERALELARERYGEDDPRLATDINNLAETYRLMGRLDEAEKLYRRALELDARRGVGDAAATAATLNNLALLYRARGRFEEAERLYVQAIGMLEESVGARHPDMSRLLNNYAMLKLARGDAASALELERRALELARDGLGADHPSVRVLESNLERIRTALARSPALAAEPGAGPKTPPASPAPAGPGPAARVEPAAVAAREPAATSSGFAVQLAALRSREEALQAASRLRERHPQLAGLGALPPEAVEIEGRGRFWRILFGPFDDRARADETCRALREAGADCLVRTLGG